MRRQRYSEPKPYDGPTFLDRCRLATSGTIPDLLAEQEELQGILLGPADTFDVTRAAFLLDTIEGFRHPREPCRCRACGIAAEESERIRGLGL